MRLHELSDQQKRDLDVFHLLLEFHGWDDPENTEHRLSTGQDVTPEGYRSLLLTSTRLEARFHAPVNMISISLTDLKSEDRIKIHFLFDKQPERVLEWIAEMTVHMNLNNYQDQLKGANGTCEMILLEVSDTEIYEVKPAKKA
ncbi:hypothetical protein [Pontibacter sp. G13]|uniref:hypothetical protein n=1 Tax=Pontibacter sp. G13 TaxID=3074898 RepID=UPI00288BBE98|nr:hypothetical protein [Pontibacter sp. G13]WNJ20404.1 hypothetical protein RJD25_07975 [Pontibacter sp. G13]